MPGGEIRPGDNKLVDPKTVQFCKPFHATIPRTDNGKAVHKLVRQGGCLVAARLRVFVHVVAIVNGLEYRLLLLACRSRDGAVHN